MKTAYNKIDEVGNRYGKLQVRSEAGSSALGLRLWNCECECGGSIITSGYYLRQNRKRSCGCGNMRKRGNSNPKWAGFNELSGTYWHRLRTGAIARSLSFDITIESIWDLFVNQEGKCAMTGMSIHFSPMTEASNLSLQTASLDRIDSSIGYTISNCQWLHKDVNMMKQSFSEEYFINLCSSIVKFRT